MHIVASQEMGELGAAESTPLTIRWYPFYAYPALSLWLVFVVVLLAAGAYRSRQLWYILIPVLATHLFWVTFKTISRMPSYEAQLFAQIVVPLYITVGALFVFADRIRHQAGLVVFLLAAAVLAFGGVLSFFAFNSGGTEISKPTMMAFVFYGIVSAALLLALAIARFLCRDRFSRLRFAVWVLVWVFLLTILFVLVYGFYDYRPSDFDDILEVLAAGALFGLCTCGIVLPFLILAFTNAFYRQMLYDCLGLASTPHESTDSASEQA